MTWMQRFISKRSWFFMFNLICIGTLVITGRLKLIPDSVTKMRDCSSYHERNRPLFRTQIYGLEMIIRANFVLINGCILLGLLLMYTFVHTPALPLSISAALLFLTSNIALAMRKRQERQS